MKSNMVNINQRDEEKSFYKCHFCYQKIDMYGIEQHFATFHKFRHSYEREYICEFCDDFEEFHSQTSLFQHIQNSHNLMNEEEIQSEAIANVDTLEEGKSKFLQLIVNFNSQEDVFNLLEWIKGNDTNLFITNHQGIENETDIEQETDVILTQKEHNTNIQEGIENQYLVVEENISKTSDEDDENILHEEMDNADSNSEGDLEQETDIILTQKDINTSMNKEQGIENQYPVIEENVSEIFAEDDERILQEDMDNADFNSLADFDQETDVILTQRFEEDVDQNRDFNHMNGSVIRIHECVECKKSFSKAQKLRNHIDTVHEGRKDYKCKTCDKSFSQAGDLKKHIYTVHEGHKDYKCQSCKKSFTALQILERHLHTVHDGYKDHKCESCGKSFSQAQGLKKHIHRVHEGHKDYKCQSCEKLFSHSGDLKKHIYAVHEGHKDYKCDSCGKSFTQLISLERHLHTVHDGYRDHKCESCDKSFTHAYTLKKHIHTVHEGHKDHKCEFCNRSFTRATTLNNHIFIVHNV